MEVVNQLYREKEGLLWSSDPAKIRVLNKTKRTKKRDKEKIAALAYEIWSDRGGDVIRAWLEAEDIVEQRAKK